MRIRSSRCSPRASFVSRLRLKVHYLPILTLIGWLPVAVVPAAVAAIPIQEERLGAWHYLYPLEFFEGGDAKHSRSASAPTTVAFGADRDRIACLMPGSTKIGEFKAGAFDDLQLPAEWTPLSLGVDAMGGLFCLAQHSEGFGSYHEWKKRWIVEKTRDGWKAAVPVPYDSCDRLEFDAENRLWALGPAPVVGFLKDGKWTTYTYSNDRHLEFLPLRMAEAKGQVTLFAWERRPAFGNVSRLVGTLTYRDNAFVRDAKASTVKLCETETHIHDKMSDDTLFERATGYVCHTKALNAQTGGPRTVLRTSGYILVSLGNNGLVWAKASDLEHAQPLPADEWEPILDITVPPRVDREGNLWVGRGRSMQVFRKSKAETLEGELPEGEDFTIDFDQLDRPWIMKWHGSTEGAVTVCAEGKLKHYPNLASALLGETLAYKAGRILPFAVKTPAGTIAVAGGYFGSCFILDSKGTHTFSARQIDPDQREPHFGHGYNPFRGAEPWFNRDGQIHTTVDEKPFLFDTGRSRWVAAKDEKPEDADFWPLIEDQPNHSKPFEGEIEATGDRKLIFKGFHFHIVDQGKERQVDFGVNPLAFYPFWTGWYRSPGLTRPEADPTGKIWISPLGPYAGNREWWVLRKPAW